MKKFLQILFLSVIGFGMVLIQTIQYVQIYNLQKEVEKQKLVNMIIKNEIKESEQKTERMIDSCLNIIVNGVWE